MKRISIGHVASVLGFFLAVATTGCFGQAGVSEDGTDDSASTSQSDNEPTVADPQNPEFRGRPSEALELKVHPTDEEHGPSPEPWEAQQGPSPEPWNGHAIIIDSDGTKKP
jgi:hypothetical protein